MAPIPLADTASDSRSLDALRPVARRGSSPTTERREAPEATTKVRDLEAARDRRLVRRARSGDSAAFEELYRLHRSRVFALALSYVRDEKDAEDVVQEVFLRVHRSLGDFQGSSRLFTWLYRITANLAIDHLRRPRRREVALDDVVDEHLSASRSSEPPGFDPHEQLRMAALGARIHRCIEQLPVYHRDVIVMRELRGLSYEEMAVLAGVSKGTIMSRLFHARQKLQRALRDSYREHFG